MVLSGNVIVDKRFMNALGFTEMALHLQKGEWSHDQAIRYKLGWMVFENKRILKKYGFIDLNDDDDDSE